MARVQLNNGAVVDALVLVRSNFRDFMDHANRIQEKYRGKHDGNHPVDSHSNTLISEMQDDITLLKNIIYFINLDIEHLPVRHYKQPTGIRTISSRY